MSGSEPIKPHGHGACWCGMTHTSMNHHVKEPDAVKEDLPFTTGPDYSKLYLEPAKGPDEKEVVGTVLSVTEDEHGVTAEIRLAPGWTVERIEEKLKQFFWGGPDDFNFNEINYGEPK